MLRHHTWASALTISVALAITSCGGGTDVASGVGSGGTGSYTNGPIAGLGSIIVNGVRYDVSSTALQVDSDDGSSYVASDLVLGMSVEVRGSEIVLGVDGVSLEATASSVRVHSDLVGVVDAIPGPTSISVGGQIVTLSGKTVLPARMAVGDSVVVYGLVDASGAYTATRVDVPTVASDVDKITGLIQSIDVGAKVLRIGQNGGVAVRYTTLPDGLVSGVNARVWFKQTNGVLTATQIQVDQPLAQNTAQARLEGVITQAPMGQVMRVNGASVDVSNATLFGGAATALQSGQRVRIVGSVASGVLIAQAVVIEDGARIDQQEIQLNGRISNLQGSAFMVHEVLVDASALPSTVLSHLSEGLCVEVRGTAYSKAGTLIATQVTTKSDCRN